MDRHIKVLLSSCHRNISPLRSLVITQQVTLYKYILLLCTLVSSDIIIAKAIRLTCPLNVL